MRLIDADVLEQRCNEMIENEWNKNTAPYSWAFAYEQFVEDLEDAPTVDAAEVLRGMWISVEDRLPELIPCSAGTGYSEAVVVLTSGKKAMIAIWDGVDFICAASYWDAEGEQITHWMPLPELPEEDKP